jgi:predicted KAP-like P-loop ATPase
MKEQVIFSSNIKFSKRFMSNFKWSLIFTPVLIAFLIATPINFNEIIYNIHYLIIVFSY